MTLLLSLVRHAKSSWVFPIEDFQRPLAEIGIERALKLQKIIEVELVKADVIYSSPAVRAKETASILLKGLDFEYSKLKISHELYTFDCINLEKFVKNLDSSNTHVFLLGHNTAITDFVNKFGDRYIENVPTSGWVTLAFEAENWNQIHSGKTIRFRSHRDNYHE